MFAFAPIDQESVEYGAWGSPLHGLYEFYYGDPAAVALTSLTEDRSNVLTNVGTPGMRVPRDVTQWMSTAAARLVDTGATFTRNPQLVDYDEARANEWRSKAIVNDNRFWTRLNPAVAQWVYTDPNGIRWSVIPDFDFFKPNRVIGKVTVAPFGQFKYPKAFWNIDDEPDDDFPTYTYEIDGAAGIVDSVGVTTETYIMDINNTGTKCLVGLGRTGAQDLYPFFDQTNFENDRNFRKSGAEAMAGVLNHTEVWAIYLFTLSGTPNDADDPFIVDLSIYKDQETTVGTIENDQNDEVSFRVWSAYYQKAAIDGVFSRPFLVTVPPGTGEVSIGATLPHITIGPTTDDEFAFCGWTREDCAGNNHIVDDPFNPTATRWIRHTGDPDQTDDGDITEWEASVEYVVPPAFPNNSVQYNGFVFEVLIAHTSDSLTQPGVGASWQSDWEVQFAASAMVIGDIPLWAEEVTYSSFDAVHDGGANYYLAKGAHESDDASEDINEPGVGSAWENFWDGPFLVAVADFWVPDRVFYEGWIIKSGYTEPAFSGDATLDVNTATFLCIRSHESASDTQPGVGANWRVYWEKANDAPAGQDEWVPPVEYIVGDRVDNVTGDDKRYTCIVNHTSVAGTQPPGAFWFEGDQPTDCPALLADSIGSAAYHLGRGGTGALPNPTRGQTGFKASNVDIDYHIKDIYAWVQFRDDDTIKEYTIDVRYEQTKRDQDIDFCWSAPGRQTTPDQPLPMEPDDVVVYTGEMMRGPSTVDEQLTYKFRTDGTERHEITIIANAEASGEDIWTENYTTYPLTWNPASNRSLSVFLEGALYGSINDNFDENDFGNTDFPPGSFQKQDWGPNGANNDFCGGLTFQYIDTPYMQQYLNLFESAFGSGFAFPGPRLTSLFGGTVLLDAINPSFSAQFDSRPQRTVRQQDEGDPLPTIAFTIYSPKLVGPLVMGRKNHLGFGVDGQYRNILEPNDFPWQQFGLFGPDAESPSKVTLTTRSPTVGVVPWLLNGDYGDDISCAYDPFSHEIHRNSEYKVVYL